MKLFKYILILSNFFVLTSCEVSNQVKQMKNFSKNKFRLVTVDSVKIAGVSLMNVKKLSDLSLSETAVIAGSLTFGTSPLNADLVIETKNNSNEIAAINELEWRLYLDNNEIANGITTKKIVVPVGDSVIFRLPINADVRKLLSKEQRKSITNLALGLADLSNNPTRMVVKIKPTFNVAGIKIKYPKYINLTKNFNED